MSVLDTMRARFETWYTGGKAGCPSIERSATNQGDYKLMQAQAAWTVWVAAQDDALEVAAGVVIKKTRVPRDLLGPATPAMKAKAQMGEAIAADIRASRTGSAA